MKLIKVNQTMTKKNRVRVDYMPSPAALEALELAQALHPKDNTQALIDRMVIVGLSALMHERWEPPRFYARNRKQWQLPPALRQPVPADDG